MSMILTALGGTSPRATAVAALAADNARLRRDNERLYELLRNASDGNAALMARIADLSGRLHAQGAAPRAAPPDGGAGVAPPA